MKAARSWMQNRVVRGTATTAAAVALIAIGVPAMALASHPASRAGPSQIGRRLPATGRHLLIVHQLPR